MSEEKQLQENSVQENVKQNPAGQDNAIQDNGIQEKAPEKKKLKIGVRIAIVAAAVLLVGVAGFAAGKIYKAVKKANMSPTEYYQYVLKETRKDSLEKGVGYYDASQKSLSGDKANREVDMSVQVSDTAKSLMSLSGLDFSGLKNLGLTMVYGTKDEDVLASLAVKVNEEDLLTGKAAINTAKKEAYVQVPELSSSYLDVSSTLSQLSEESNTPVFSIGKQYEALPDGKEFEDFIVRYSDILIESAEKVEKKQETTVKVEDISEKATIYTFTMKNDKITQLAEKCLKELEKDAVMKKILQTIDEESYDSFVDAVKEAQGKLSDTLSEKNAGEIKATVEAQINSDDRIVSQKVTLEVAGEELGSLSFSQPSDGKKFGEEIVVQAQGKDLVKIVGSGTNDSDVVNGEYTVGVDSSLLEGSNLVNTDELLVIKLKDCDYSKMEKGEVKGSYTLSTSAVSNLANCSLVLEQEGNMDDMKQKIKIMTGKDTLVTMDVTSKGNAKLPEVAPSDSDKVYKIDDNTDMVTYQSELDVAGLLQKVQDKTGIDLNSLMGLGSLGDEGYTDPGDLNYDVEMN